MSRSYRCLPSMLFTLSLLTACAAQTSSTPVVVITPNHVATATLTFEPAAATSLPTSSPFSDISIPTFDSFQPVTPVSLAEAERVLNMVAESDGNLWLLTDQRVTQYSQDTWTDYLPQFSGTLIGMDSTHHVWVLSDDRAQISVWDGSTWRNLGPESGWEPPMPDSGMEINWSFTTDALGQVWLATDRDVRVFDSARWKIFDLNELGMPRPEEADAFSETTLAFLKTGGSIWAINCYWIGPGPSGGGGARWYDGHVWQGSNSPVARGCATVINEDNLGNIWLGLDNDLWRLNTSSVSWKRFPGPKPPVEGNRFGFFTDLAFDPIGNPWPQLSVCGGASCYAGNVRYRLTQDQWLQIGDVASDISSLYFDPTGQGWVFAPDGVFRIAENRLEPVAEISVLKVTVSPSGKLWIVGNYEGETVLWAQDS